jgi:hypothetical protein
MGIYYHLANDQRALKTVEKYVFFPKVANTL